MISYAYKNLTIGVFFPTLQHENLKTELKPIFGNGSLFITKDRKIVWSFHRLAVLNIQMTHIRF